MQDKEQRADPDVLARIAALPCWSGPVEASALDGGMTNRNYLVRDAAMRYVVRLGEDLPPHGIVRWHELAVARAAHAAGLSPEVVHAQSGVLVSRFVDGVTLTPRDMRDPIRLAPLVALIKQCHQGMPRHLMGPVLMFWVFQVIRNYLALLAGQAPNLLHAQLPRYAAMAADLERAVGAVEIVFGHNDLLAGNFIDDGARLWLIDWEYAGFNSPLFDLANVSVNNGFDLAHNRELLQLYFGRLADTRRWRAFVAMRCASVLRETLWAVVSHHTSPLAFDYATYAHDWHGRLDSTWETFASCPAPD